MVSGEAWWIDHYGNVQTNISPEDLQAIGLRPGSVVTLRAGARLHQVRWVAAYGDVDDREPLLHVDSSGLMALAVRSGRADEELGLSLGMSVSIAGVRDD